MSVIKFIAYLAMFIIKEILNLKTYINNLFIIIKKQKKVYQFFAKKKTLEIFLDKNINSYIRLNSKIWKKSKKLNTESEKKVLIESLINHPQYLIINCIIGLRLSLFHNLDCVGMIRRGDLVSEKIMKSFGIKEVVEIDYGNFFSRLFFFFKRNKNIRTK